MPLTPFIRTPFTDLTGGIFTTQEGGTCGALEMKLVNCMEAYGVDRAKAKCGDIIDDFQECLSNTKQRMRVYEMRVERHNQIASGERKGENRYIEGPKLDSFQ